MEYAVIIVSVFLVFYLAFLIIFPMRRYKKKLDKNKEAYKAVFSALADYHITWTSDLSQIEFDEKTRMMIESTGRKADKSYIRYLFGDSSSSPVDISLVLAALSSEGVTTKASYEDGMTGIIEWKSKVIYTDGNLSVIETVGTDVTELTVTKNVMEELRMGFQRQQRFYNFLLENASAGRFTIYNEFSNVYIELSSFQRSAFGFDDDGRISVAEFMSRVKSSDKSAFSKELNSFISGQTSSLDSEVEIRDARGFYRCYLIRCRKSEILINDMPAKLGVIMDITENRNRLIHRGANIETDRSASIYSRSAFITHGDKLLLDYKKRNVPCAVVCIRITRIQKITNLFGIDITDTLMSSYSNAIQTIANGTPIIGKVGSEDFTVFLRCDGKDELERFIKNLQILVENSCDDNILPSYLKDQVGFTAGACFFDGIDDIATLYNKASVTLYTNVFSKRSPLIIFDDSVERSVFERDTLEHELGDALENGNFELYYQPKIDIETETIIGAEALMRWNHTTRGIVMPNEFIGIAEEVGLITRIDEWGLLQACMQNIIWKNKGFEQIKISVNMSQAQLYQTDLIAFVKNALEKSGMESKYLEIEITETMAMLDIERSISILGQLRELGITIAMDDFGTGYSSLSALKQLPIDVLKIDRSLVDDIVENETSRHITTAIVNLGKAMNLVILAEGVETQEQRDVLRELGCDVAQGYLYSKPQPAAVIEKKFLNAV